MLFNVPGAETSSKRLVHSGRTRTERSNKHKHNPVFFKKHLIWMQPDIFVDWHCEDVMF